MRAAHAIRVEIKQATFLRREEGIGRELWAGVLNFIRKCANEMTPPSDTSEDLHNETSQLLPFQQPHFRAREHRSGAEIADTAGQSLLQFEFTAVEKDLGDLLGGESTPGFGSIFPCRAGGTRLVEIIPQSSVMSR